MNRLNMNYMIINRHIILLLLICIALGANAKKKQKYPHADIKVSYLCHEDHLKTDAKAYTEEYQMILLANSSSSKFYNLQAEYIDSLHTSSSGKAIYREIIGNMAKKYAENGVFDDSALPKCRMYVFKSRNDSILSFYDRNGSSHEHFYTEPLDEIEWEIGDSTKSILGYECIMAETDFHGRHWTAWFAPEIPVQDGPWKLCGLPGMILEAKDSSGQHSFTADGIEMTDIEIKPVYNEKNYEKVSRLAMLAAQRKFLLQGDSMSRMLIQNTPDGSRIEMPESQYNANPDLHIDFLETDYH